MRLTDRDKYLIRNFLLAFLQTDSEVACEEAARLTADIQDDTPDDDDELCEYHDMPPPPDGG